MTNVYSIGSGRQNKMFCLYITFTEYRSYGCFEKTHHVANLSTDYKKAVAKAKSIFEEYKDNSKLVIQEEWELNEIKRDAEANNLEDSINRGLNKIGSSFINIFTCSIIILLQDKSLKNLE